MKTKNNFLGGVVVIAVVIVISILLASRDKDKKTTVSNAPSLPANITPVMYQDHFAAQPHLLLDVRTPEEFATGHIDGAINISLQTLADNLSQVPTDNPVVVYCHSGNRSAQAADLLKKAGYSQVYDLGGILDWQAQGFPVIQ